MWVIHQAGRPHRQGGAITVGRGERMTPFASLSDGPAMPRTARTCRFCATWTARRTGLAHCRYRRFHRRRMAGLLSFVQAKEAEEGVVGVRKHSGELHETFLQVNGGKWGPEGARDTP